MDCTISLHASSNLEIALKSGIDNNDATVYGAPRRRSKGLAEINLSRSEVDWVISSAGRPAGQPNLKKPTALRGVVGVWDCESSDRIKGL